MIRSKPSIFLCILRILYLDMARCSEVVQLNVLFRHGDRAPETFPKRFPNDPHMNDTFYPMGSGGLLNAGKQRMYRLGEILRENYSEILSTENLNKKLYAISSDTSRTKMSLQLVLAALYPSSLYAERWNDKLNWQPIPTLYNKLKYDMLFHGDSCEWYIDEFKKVFNLAEVQSQFEEYKTYLEELRITVGKKSPITPVDILLLHNNLDIENRMNLRMEPWMLEALADERLIRLRQLFYTIQNYNDTLRRLLAGSVMRQINENLQSLREKTPTITLFSAHDKNIISLLQLLGVYDLHFPEFSSALIFELLRQKNEYYVKIVYYLGIPEETKMLKLPGCDTLCPLVQFIALTKHLQITDEELDCQIKVDSYFEEDF